MHLFTFLSSGAPNRVFFSVLFGALAGVSYALLIPTILTSVGVADTPTEQPHYVLGFEVANHRFALAFVGMCLFILATRSVSQVLLVRVAMDATARLRTRMYEAIRGAPVKQLETVGFDRMFATITTDPQRIVAGAMAVPSVLIAGVTIIGVLSYLAVLDGQVTLLVICAIAFGAVTYQIPVGIGQRYFGRGRQYVDVLYESIRGLIFGSKELRLNRAKADYFVTNVLEPTERMVRSNNKRGSTIITIASAYGDLLSFLVIGVLIYVFVNYHPIGAGRLMGVVMALLYITGPIALIFNAVPQITGASISIAAMNRVLTALSREDVDESMRRIADVGAVRFDGVRYSYRHENDCFTLGPINAEFRRGEISFIVGGNGSGKSTLCKLIALHYPPDEGRIQFGPVEVSRDTVNSCRQSISAIFSDYFIFDRVLANVCGENESVINEHLSRLQLPDKVSVGNGFFSSKGLSDGQRKRLALLVMLLENRQICIFDEWAADQDPKFKHVFYHEILPALRSKGKIVIVISHDDRYFHVADSLLVMEDGVLVKSDRLPTVQPMTPVAERRLA